MTVASVHLSLVPEERREHARLVREAVRGLGPAPYVVAGDLNEQPDGPAWLEFGRLLTDAVVVGAVAVGAAGGAALDPVGEPTFPARAPARRIDAVLVSEGVVVESVRVPGPADGIDPVDLACASDHLPVVADLRVVSVPALP